ncbi:hypothetical protein, partial [Leisingera sp. MMG026]|uniref:hypothetical protein n=1 Tax=Leisingera sp. MMG026 TaxID=2909982 RepID=UPI001F2AE5E6
TVNLVFMLRALAARRSAALPNFSRCMAEENAAIPASRSKSETTNSRVAGQICRLLFFSELGKTGDCSHLTGYG